VSECFCPVGFLVQALYISAHLFAGVIIVNGRIDTYMQVRVFCCKGYEHGQTYVQVGLFFCIVYKYGHTYVQVKML